MSISLKNLLDESIKYSTPPIDVTQATRGGSNPKTKAAARQLFYDFYAMSNMHYQFGRPSMSIAAKVKASMNMKDFGAGMAAGANWDEVEFPTTGIILPHKTVEAIEDVYEQVTHATAGKLLEYLRLALVQELRHIISHSNGWSGFRQALVSVYNSKKTISQEDFKKAVNSHIPKMAGDIPSVMRLLKFSKYYSKMKGSGGEDAFDAARKNIPIPGKPPYGSENEPEVAPAPDVPYPTKPEDEFPDDTDYTAEPIDDPFADEPTGGSPSSKDPNYSDEDTYWDPDLKKQIKAKGHVTPPSKKNLEEDYASGRISPSTIAKVKTAIDKAGLTWEDIDNAYNKVPWGGGYGGPKWGTGTHAFLKLTPEKYNQISTEDLAQMVDHIFDLVHNGGPLLNKGGMFMDEEDLDRRAKMTDVARYLPYVSPSIKGIISNVLRHLYKDPETQKNIGAFLNSPTKPFTPEEDKVLFDKTEGKAHANGDARRINIRFFSKKKDDYGNAIEVNGRYYELKSHVNGKYTIADDLKADIQIFDTFAELATYTDRFKSDIKGGKAVPTSAGYVVPPKSAKDIYIDAHSRIKLPVDKEQMLYQIKLGWRTKSKYYKAYYPGDKRFLFYAFSDGTFLANYLGKDDHKVFNDWDTAFEYCNTQTVDADDSHQAEAAANIGKGGSGTIVAPPVGTPSVAKPSPSKPSTEFYLEPLEEQSLAQLVSYTFPATTAEKYAVGKLVNGMTLVQKVKNGNPTDCFSVGKRTVTYGKPYRIQHQLGAVNESWMFQTWKQAFDFIKTHIQELVVPLTLAQQTPTTPSSGNFAGLFGSTTLPANASSKAAYNVHAGITEPPKNTIRLTKEDEAIIQAAGFEPKVIASNVWYVHKVAGDTVKFFPNDTAKLIFTNKSVSPTGAPILKFSIEKMLKWLPQQYTAASTTSPLQAGAKPVAPLAGTAGSAGIQPGSIFEKRINDAGFVFNPALGHYADGSNVLVIHKDRSSFLSFGGTNSKQFKNLPDLINYLSDEYPAQKKTLAVPNSSKKIQVNKLKELLVKGGFNKVGVPPASGKKGIKYANDKSDVIIIYNDESANLFIPATNETHIFHTLEQLNDFLQQHYDPVADLGGLETGNEPVAHDGITPQEENDIKEVVGKYGQAYWTEYVKGSMGQSSYVEIFKKSSSKEPATIIYSIGAIGNYYQINDGNNKPIKNYQSFKILLYDLDYTLKNDGPDGGTTISGGDGPVLPTLPSSDPNSIHISEANEIEAEGKKYGIQVDPYLQNQATGAFLYVHVGEIPYYIIRKKEGLYEILYSADNNTHYTDVYFSHKWSKVMPDYSLINNPSVTDFDEFLGYIKEIFSNIAGNNSEDPVKDAEAPSEKNKLSESEVSAIFELLDKNTLPTFIWKERSHKTTGLPYVSLYNTATKKNVLVVLKAGEFYQVSKVIGNTWESLVSTPSFHSAKTIAGAFVDSLTPKVLTENEKDWVITYVSTHKPEVTIAAYHDGSVMAFDNTNTKFEVPGNPLFLVRKTKSLGYLLTYFNLDSGQEPINVQFIDFGKMQDYIKNNLDSILTKLIKVKHLPEDIDLLGELPGLLANAKFAYHSDIKTPKNGKVYVNDSGEHISYYDDGSSKVAWNIGPDSAASGKTQEFKTPNQLINWVKSHYGIVPLTLSEEVEQLLKTYHYQGTYDPEGAPASWVNSQDDTINIHNHDVTIYPAVASENISAYDINLDDLAQLKDYLNKKHGGDTVTQVKEFEKVLKDANFELVVQNSPKFAAVYKTPNGDLVHVHNEHAYRIDVLPSAHHAAITTVYINIVDATYFISEHFGIGIKNPKWSVVDGHTGDIELDEILIYQNFTYNGTMAGDPLAMVFIKADGTKLTIYDDKSATYNWSPLSQEFLEKEQTSTGLKDFATIKEFLVSNFLLTSEPESDLSFVKNSAMKKSWNELWNTILDSGYDLKDYHVPSSEQDPLQVKSKLYKNQHGHTIVVKDDGTCTYAVSSGATPEQHSYSSLKATLDNLNVLGQKTYSKNYYNDVGPSKNGYSIRLTKEDEAAIESLGWVFSPSEVLYMHNESNSKLVFINHGIGVNKSKPIAIKYDGGVESQLAEKTIAEVIVSLQHNQETVHETSVKTGGKYSTHYYDDVGPEQNSYAIRLTKADEKQLTVHGFVWIRDTDDKGSMSYVNTSNFDHLAFINLSWVTGQPAAKFTDKLGYVKASFNTIKEALTYVSANVPTLGNGLFSLNYYQTVGPTKNSVTIRLTAEDEMVMRKGGFKWVVGDGGVGYYLNLLANKKILFYNKGLENTKSAPAAHLQDIGDSTLLKWSTVEEALKWVSNTASSKSIMHYNEASPIMLNKLPEFPPHTVDEVVFKYIDNSSNNVGFGELWVSGAGKLKFALGIESTGASAEKLYYIRQITEYGEKNYTFPSEQKMLEYVKKHATELATHKVIYTPHDPKLVGISGGNISKKSTWLPSLESITAGAAGFKPETADGIYYLHISKEFMFRYYGDTLSWSTEKGVKEITLPEDAMIEFIKKVLTKVSTQMTGDEIDKIFSKENATREEKLMDRMLRIAKQHNGVWMSGTNFDKGMEAKGFTWNEFDKCYMNEGLFQVVVVTPAFGNNSYHLYWITSEGKIGHSTPSSTLLMAAIGKDGQLNTSKKSSRDHLLPSGELYAQHSGMENAELVKLNDHDEGLLSSSGFEWAPSENHYYKNAKGDVFKFYSNGTAELHDVTLHQGFNFPTIIEALKFAVDKYVKNAATKPPDTITVSPFSNQNYNTNPNDEHLTDIKLNDYDHNAIEQLGFKYSEDKGMYIKEITSKDTPKLEEAGKKKKKKKDKNDPEQFELPLNDPEYGYEIVIPYNSGNATWTATSDPSYIGVEKEHKDGTIKEILDFVWHRWSDTLTSFGQTDHTTEELNKLGFVFASQISNGGYEYVKHVNNQIKQVQIYPEDKFVFSVFDSTPGQMSKKLGQSYVSTISVGMSHLNKFENDEKDDFEKTAHQKIKLSGHNYNTIAQDGIQQVIPLHPDDGALLEKIGFTFDPEGYGYPLYTRGDTENFAAYNDDTAHYQDSAQSIDEYFKSVKEGLMVVLVQHKDPAPSDADVYAKQYKKETDIEKFYKLGFHWDAAKKSYINTADGESVTFVGDNCLYNYISVKGDKKTFATPNTTAVVNKISAEKYNKAFVKIEKMGFFQMPDVKGPSPKGSKVSIEYFKAETKEVLQMLSDGKVRYGAFDKMSGEFIPYQTFDGIKEAAEYLSNFDYDTAWEGIPVKAPEYVHSDLTETFGFEYKGEVYLKSSLGADDWERIEFDKSGIINYKFIANGVITEWNGKSLNELYVKLYDNNPEKNPFNTTDDSPKGIKLPNNHDALKLFKSGFKWDDNTLSYNRGYSKIVAYPNGQIQFWPNFKDDPSGFFTNTSLDGLLASAAQSVQSSAIVDPQHISPTPESKRIKAPPTTNAKLISMGFVWVDGINLYSRGDMTVIFTDNGKIFYTKGGEYPHEFTSTPDLLNKISGKAAMTTPVAAAPTLSDFDYEAWGKNSGYKPEQTIQLVPVDDKVMNELGFKLMYTGESIEPKYSNIYINGKGKMVVFQVGGTSTYSENGANVTKFNNPKSMILWLSANQRAMDNVVQVPANVNVAKGKEATEAEIKKMTEELESMGFEKAFHTTHILNKSDHKGDHEVNISAEHKTIKYTLSNLGDVLELETLPFQEAMDKLRSMFGAKNKVTGKMPFSGFAYHTLWKTQGINKNVSVRLVAEDELVMNQMGFSYVADGNTNTYQKRIEQMVFVADGTAKYYLNKNDKVSTSGFSKVKTAMEFLWKKHAPFIEENLNGKLDYKSMMSLALE